jgi:hypothetical protein
VEPERREGCERDASNNPTLSGDKKPEEGILPSEFFEEREVVAVELCFCRFQRPAFDPAWLFQISGGALCVNSIAIRLKGSEWIIFETLKPISL